MPKFTIMNSHEAVYDTEEEAVEFAKSGKNRAINQYGLADAMDGPSGAPKMKTLIVACEVVRTIEPSVVTGPGGDQHFANTPAKRAEFEAKMRDACEAKDALASQYVPAGKMAGFGGAYAGSLSKQRLD